jgi:hypothetical protein
MEQGLRIIGTSKRIAQVEGWNAGCVVMVWAGLRRVVKRGSADEGVPQRLKP